MEPALPKPVSAPVRLNAGAVMTSRVVGTDSCVGDDPLLALSMVLDVASDGAVTRPILAGAAIEVASRLFPPSFDTFTAGSVARLSVVGATRVVESVAPDPVEASGEVVVSVGAVARLRAAGTDRLVADDDPPHAHPPIPGVVIRGAVATFRLTGAAMAVDPLEPFSEVDASDGAAATFTIVGAVMLVVVALPESLLTPWVTDGAVAAFTLAGTAMLVDELVSHAHPVLLDWDV